MESFAGHESTAQWAQHQRIEEWKKYGSHLIPFHQPKWETPTVVAAALRGVNWTASERESDASRNHYTNKKWHQTLGLHAVLEKLKPRNIS